MRTKFKIINETLECQPISVWQLFLTRGFQVISVLGDVIQTLATFGLVFDVYLL